MKHNKKEDNIRKGKMMMEKGEKMIMEGKEMMKKGKMMMKGEMPAMMRTK